VARRAAPAPRRLAGFAPPAPAAAAAAVTRPWNVLRRGPRRRSRAAGGLHRLARLGQGRQHSGRGQLGHDVRRRGAAPPVRPDQHHPSLGVRLALGPVGERGAQGRGDPVQPGSWADVRAGPGDGASAARGGAPRGTGVPTTPRPPPPPLEASSAVRASAAPAPPGRLDLSVVAARWSAPGAPSGDAGPAAAARDRSRRSSSAGSETKPFMAETPGASHPRASQFDRVGWRVGRARRAWRARAG
jgi:hypothetical protein